jgi:hypothetical protein
VLLIGRAISSKAAVGGVSAAKKWDEKHRMQLEERARLLCGQDAIYKTYYAELPRDVFDRKVAKLGLGRTTALDTPLALSPASP